MRMSRPSSLTRLGSLLSPNSPRSFRKQMTNKLDFPDLNGERGASCFLNVSIKIGGELSDCLMSIQCAVYQVFLNVLNLCGGYTDGR